MWKQLLRLHVVPWALEDVELGPHVLELGPGYGASTDWRRGRFGIDVCQRQRGDFDRIARREWG